MSTDDSALYDQDAADALKERERSAAKEQKDQEKLELLNAHIPPCHRLVDIGCGWGQLLGMVQGRVVELWGVDESPERVRDVHQACPTAKVVVCRANALDLPDDCFDVAVMSQMLHEVKLFGQPDDLAAALGEVRRVLGPGGRYLLLDHLDAGDGEVVARLPQPVAALMDEFERKYQYRDAAHEDLGDGAIRITKRDLQDFLTKDWSLNTSMEAIEMNETHNVFQRNEAAASVESAGLTVQACVPFQNIADDLARVGGTLVEGEPWPRKFLMVAVKE
jgi:ubiquinone/menaquinone biosynthesis C-methylase UbiE